MLDKINGTSDSLGIGFMMSWSGEITPQATFGASRNVESSGLASFVSKITGDNVHVVADKIAADLDQIFARAELKTETKERATSPQAKPYMDNRAWGMSGGISVEEAKDGPVVVPRINPFYEQENLKGKTGTSAILNSYLIDVLKDFYSAPRCLDNGGHYIIVILKMERIFIRLSHEEKQDNHY